MKTIMKDDRTEEEKITHRWGVVARDSAMSHWGLAKNGISRVAWACATHIDASLVFDWVATRKEMKNASIVDLRKYTPPRKDAHFHIYVCDPETHIALQIHE